MRELPGARSQAAASQFPREAVDVRETEETQ